MDRAAGMTGRRPVNYRIDESHNRSVTLVLRWCEWYTRGLPPEVVQDRFDEIASDLHEQEADLVCDGVHPVAWRRLILNRAARGVPADLIWRETQLRRMEAMRLGLAPTREVVLTTRIAVAVLALGGLAVAAGALACMRTIAVGADIVGASTAGWQAAATLVLALALFLFTRPTTRLVGGLVAAPALVAVVWVVGASAIMTIAALPFAPAIIASSVLLARMRRR